MQYCCLAGRIGGIEFLQALGTRSRPFSWCCFETKFFRRCVVPNLGPVGQQDQIRVNSSTSFASSTPTPPMWRGLRPVRPRPLSSPGSSPQLVRRAVPSASAQTGSPSASGAQRAERRGELLRPFDRPERARSGPNATSRRLSAGQGSVILFSTSSVPPIPKKQNCLSGTPLFLGSGHSWRRASSPGLKH